MEKLKFRHELKHRITHPDCAELRQRLKFLAHPDENSDGDGCYTVHSLYFDDYKDTAVIQKLAGVPKREKFRIRYYNSDTSFIRLEKKTKVNGLCAKESAVLTKKQCEDIINGNYGCLKESNIPLLLEFYAKIHYRLLRPKNIVCYTREAFVYAPGNTRITIDTGLRSSGNVSEFFNPGHYMMPTATAVILEIKYDNFIPEAIVSLVGLRDRHVSEFSKYVNSRFIKGDNNYV